MADTTNLRPYQPQDYPSLPASKDRYITGELSRISYLLTQMITTMQKLEARLAAGGL